MPKHPGGWRRALSMAGLGAAGLIVVALVGFGAMFWFGGNDVENFCRDAVPGLPFAELVALAGKHDVRLTAGADDGSGAQSLLAHTPRSYGRHTCLVRHDGKTVIESRYEFTD